MKSSLDKHRERSCKLARSIEHSDYLLDQIEQEYRSAADIAVNAGQILTRIDHEFAELTKLEASDIAFLFLAVAMQCLRQYFITPFTERVSDQEAAKSVKGKEKETSDRSHKWYHPSLAEIITSPVPFDANFQSDALKGVLKGGGKFGHRGVTLGHDPALGLVFGTANIATSTLTTWQFQSYHVKTGERVNGSHIDQITNKADTQKVLYYTKEKLLNQGNEGKLIITTSLLKEIVHLRSDLHSIKSLPFPVVSAISPQIASALSDYGIDMANTCDFLKQAAWAQGINLLISMLHGMFFFYNQNENENLLKLSTYKSILTHDVANGGALNLHKVRTRKILSYSNAIAAGSNVIAVAITESIAVATSNAALAEKGMQYLDSGGIAVALYRLLSDYNFIQKVKREFLEQRWYEIVTTSKE